MSTLHSHLPWTVSPLLINAPMSGFAGGHLAAAVSLAGGLGLIGGVRDMREVRRELESAAELLGQTPGVETMRVGVGFLPFAMELAEVLEVVREYRPAVVWLFAAKMLGGYKEWVDGVRGVSPESRVWVQLGSVAAAVEVSREARPDVLCLQGADAGGHGFEKGASIVSLVPEVADTLAAAGLADVALVASGGIVDGRGVAAALALGAQGVVMGTRFLASREIKVHPKYQAAILEAQDGGQVTSRSKLFDQLRGPNIWPELYDGRGLVGQSLRDFASGMSLKEIQKLHNQEAAGEDKGYDTGLQGRAAIWAGTGVGLVNEVQSARDIVEKIRKETKEILLRVASV